MWKHIKVFSDWPSWKSQHDVYIFILLSKSKEWNCYFNSMLKIIHSVKFDGDAADDTSF